MEHWVHFNELCYCLVAGASFVILCLFCFWAGWNKGWKKGQTDPKPKPPTIGEIANKARDKLLAEKLREALSKVQETAKKGGYTTVYNASTYGIVNEEDAQIAIELAEELNAIQGIKAASINHTRNGCVQIAWGKATE